jgi:hypothetical protein
MGHGHAIPAKMRPLRKRSVWPTEQRREYAPHSKAAVRPSSVPLVEVRCLLSDETKHAQHANRAYPHRRRCRPPLPEGEGGVRVNS